MRTKLQLKAAAKGIRTIQRNRRIRKQIVYKKYCPPIKDPDFMLGLGLYCGEGTKEERVCFSSASPKLIRQMVSWFQYYFNIETHGYCLRIRHYGCKTEEAVKQYWKYHTGIPIANMQVSINPPSKWSQYKKGMTLPYGTAHLRLYQSQDIRTQLTKAQNIVGVTP